MQPNKSPDVPSSRYGIQSTHVFLENHFEPVEAIILIENEKIFDVIILSEADPDNLKSIQQSWKIENYGNLCIFPGLVDHNVHLHTNFDGEWDNIARSTRFAAAGGVTTVIDNPIMTKPFSDGEEYIKILQERIDTLKQKSHVDFGLFGLLEPRTQDNLEDIIKLGVVGLKAYLFSPLQNGIGSLEPETLIHYIEYLDKQFPNLLLALHPEVATERELYSSSPCRLNTLEERLDLNFEIKSLGYGGGANKGAYMEEFNKSACSVGFDDEDDDCPTPNLDTPSKLKSKIRRSKQKTEINQLVRFELMSYGGYEESKADQESSDSENELSYHSNAQSPCLRTKKENEEQNKDHSTASPYSMSGPLSGKTIKRSLFGKDEIKENILEEKETPQKSRKKQKSKFSKYNNNHDHENFSSYIKSFENGNSMEEKSGSEISQKSSLSPVRGNPSSLKNRNPEFTKPFLAKVLTDLGFDKQDEVISCYENIDTAATKSPTNAQETNDEFNKLSESNMLGSGLTNRKLESPDSELDKMLSPDGKLGFSPEFPETPQEEVSMSSPLDVDNQIDPMQSSLFHRRVVRKSSLNVPVCGKPTLLLTSKSLRVSNLEITKSPKVLSNNEHKFNVCYGVFLANRPQNWEENGVMSILMALKPDLQLRILVQNLSLASSFLNIRNKKKSDESYFKSLYGDTSSAYLFFNEKTVKKGETKYKASPPFRDRENRKLMIENFRLGGIDTVSSYHFYVPDKYKEVDDGNFRRAFSGFDSIGLNLQSLWTTMYIFYKKNNKTFNQNQIIQKKITNDVLCRMSKVLCSNPAQLLKINNQKGSIEKGKDADFVVWDPYKLINNQNLPATHIYSKRILYGLVHKTYLRGKVIYDKDDLTVNNYESKFLTPAAH